MQIEQIPLGPVCLFHSSSLSHSPSCLLLLKRRSSLPPLRHVLLGSASGHLVSLRPHLFHSLSTCLPPTPTPFSSFTPFTSLSPFPPSQKTVLGLSVCQLTVAMLSLCVPPSPASSCLLTAPHPTRPPSPTAPPPPFLN